MVLKPDDSQTRLADKVKYLYLFPDEPCDASNQFLPHFYAEAKIDFNDIRTGFRQTITLSRALEIYSENAEYLWASDMVREIDPRKVSSLKPDWAHQAQLPEFVNADFISRMETQFLHYLLRSFAVRIYRNFVLDVYSNLGESPDDFVARCYELLKGSMRYELDSLQEVFNRKLQQINQKFIFGDNGAGLEDEKARSQIQDLFYRSSDRIAELFLHARTESNPIEGSLRCPVGMEELQERLSSLESEACQAIVKLKESYVEKARSIDEYIIHPNLKDIHLVRSCILWMPPQAA